MRENRETKYLFFRTGIIELGAFLALFLLIVVLIRLDGIIALDQQAAKSNHTFVASFSGSVVRTSSGRVLLCSSMCVRAYWSNAPNSSWVNAIGVLGGEGSAKAFYVVRESWTQR